MANIDEKSIRKHYGEATWKMCRTLFPSILEEEGLLFEIMSSTFAPTRSLPEAMKSEEDLLALKDLIFSKFHKDKKEKTTTEKTAEQLFDEAGYILFPECKTEEEIQSFKRYYAPGEALCTFHGGRLNSCRVWFAVKKDVEKIIRSEHPQRQDQYGTSVISVQFTRGKHSTLSIKNRYNHTVSNPDATFSNDLDNIAPGLMDVFTEQYGISMYDNSRFREVSGYVIAGDGKYYKTNVEIDGINYCENNVIILANGEVIKLDSSKILVENYVVDFHNKTIRNLAGVSHDSFIESLGEIKTLRLEGQKIIVTPKEGEDIVIGINGRNEIVEYSNSNVKAIGDDFLRYNKQLASISLPEVKEIGDWFLLRNTELTSISLPKVKEIGDDFLPYNKQLTSISLPKVEEIGDWFLLRNTELTSISLPEVKEIGNYFLNNDEQLTSISLPNVKTIGNHFLYNDEQLTSISLPNVKTIGNRFLNHNKQLTSISAPKVEQIGDDFLLSNTELTSISLPEVKEIGDCFLNNDEQLTSISAPNVKTIGDRFLNHHKQLIIKAKVDSLFEQKQ